jgi:hypothetical protein
MAENYLDIKKMTGKFKISNLNEYYEVLGESSDTLDSIIDNYVRKNIPIIIFDRYMSITGQEFSWLKKFNVYFFEPAINNRCEFEYLPQWMPIDENPKKHRNDVNYSNDLGYTGILNDKVEMFEKYYRNYSKLYPDRKVVYNTNDQLITSKIDDWNECNLKIVDGYNFNNLILIDSKRNIEIGYMREDFYKLLINNILPILPRENKYFGCLFKNLCIESLRDIEYYVKAFRDPGIRWAVIDDIFIDIKRFYPEFTINYVCDKIKDKLV